MPFVGAGRGTNRGACSCPEFPMSANLSALRGSFHGVDNHDDVNAFAVPGAGVFL